MRKGWWGQVCPGETRSAQSFGNPAGSSVQHRSQFSWKTLRLPPLCITPLEPFLEETNKTKGREGGREVFKTGIRRILFRDKLLQSLKHESDEVTGPPDMNIPEKLHRWSSCIVKNDLNKILSSPNSL